MSGGEEPKLSKLDLVIFKGDNGAGVIDRDDSEATHNRLLFTLVDSSLKGHLNINIKHISLDLLKCLFQLHSLYIDRVPTCFTTMITHDFWVTIRLRTTQKVASILLNSVKEIV